ncbi:MAG TPA: FAD-binding oxidoreductase [Planctomycetota bacterium]|nr:FAD-binding oxidoreductase [Planctomycetota bacterium]
MKAALHPRSATELGEALRSGLGQVRLCGTGSRQDRLPAAPEAVPIHLTGLDAIWRLDAPDLTCSVDAGVQRKVLDAALQRVGLELPCPGEGTIGGLFASDALGAATAGGASPRTLLLGLEAVLADGTAWKSGARVVKSVAGFDVHKLLVGSQGRLFAATRLHLRLRPRPRAEAWFCRRGLDQAEALAQFMALRTLPIPPATLLLRRDRTGFEVAGRIAGRPSFVDAMLRTHALATAAPFAAFHLDPPTGGEVLMGIVLPSRIPALLAAAPSGAAFLVHGGGRFELGLATPAQTDRLLGSLPGIPAHACIISGSAARRGVGTPIDAGQQRLTIGLKQALDPHGIFV